MIISQTIAEIANIRAGSVTMVRLKDVAEACGVSVATVSRALNGLTNGNKERTAMICRTARDMGYYPNAAARTLKTSRSSNIGILYEDRMNHEYFSSLIDDLRSEAERQGYDLTLIGRDCAGYTDSYYDHARRRNLDGVVVIQADFESVGVIRLASSDMPTVVIDHPAPTRPAWRESCGTRSPGGTGGSPSLPGSPARSPGRGFPASTGSARSWASRFRTALYGKARTMIRTDAPPPCGTC